MRRVVSQVASKCQWILSRATLKCYLTASSSPPPKVFCIGANKTGTTSTEQIFRELGLKIAPQQKVEKYFYDIDFNLNCDLFWKWLDQYEAFQDAPFSWSWILPELIRRYPTAYYILTTRNVDAWYASIRSHHFRVLSLPDDASGKDIKNAIAQCSYISPGYFEKVLARLYGPINDDELYSENIWKQHYISHNHAARSLLRDNRFLEISLSEETDTRKICNFLGLPPFFVQQIPHLNKGYEKN